jgi:hypothetical protein
MTTATGRRNIVEHEDVAYRRPYRRGDYRLVDTRLEGTYWCSQEGVVVRIASAESRRAVARRQARPWAIALPLFGRLQWS